MTNFKELNIADVLTQTLQQMNIVTPTPIQSLAIPVALEGKDILASAQTGTGKTIAFLIPLITKLMNNPRQTALIVAPTRELAMQVRDAAKALTQKVPRLKTALLIGGDPMPRQYMQLRNNPAIIIGTPGRIVDHLDRKTLQLNHCSFLVIDEMDRMLDIGLREQLDTIKSQLPDTVQTLMFSATVPSHILSISQQYLKNPERISVGATNQPAPKIEQAVVHTHQGEKFSLLVKELENPAGSVIVFVRTKRGAAQLADRLNQLNDKRYNADAIHGDLRQSKRERVMFAFRNGKLRILIATDIAARGIDVQEVTKVINFDIPENPEDYSHRIGRTGRAGRDGYACSFVTPDDVRKWHAIQRFQEPEKYAHLAYEPQRRRSSANRSRWKSRSGFGSRNNNENGNRRSSGRSHSFVRSGKNQQDGPNRSMHRNRPAA